MKRFLYLTLAYLSASSCIALEHEDYSIGETPCDQCPQGKVFLLKDSTSDRQYQFPAKMARVEKMLQHDDKLLVQGELSSNVKLFVLISLNDFEPLDIFIGMNPALSPSNRYLLYERFYPRFGPDETKTSVIMLYDLTKDHRKQRVTHFEDSDEAAISAGNAINASHLTEDEPVWVEDPSERQSLVALAWAHGEDVASVVLAEGNRRRLILVEPDAHNAIREFTFQNPAELPPLGQAK